MKNKIAPILVAAGVLLVLTASFLFWDGSAADRKAGESAKQLLSQLKEELPQPMPSPMEASPDASPPLAAQAMGILSIPSLGLELPVMEECTDELLELSVCRYAGNGPGEKGFAIAGHSYDSLFGKLSHLKEGDSLSFRDLNGTETAFRVLSWDYIPGDDPDALDASSWDLTLFTCSFDGSDRLTVRCEKTA